MKLHKYLQYILVSVAIIFYSSLMAQGTWETFTKEKDGLTSNKVRQIFKDSKGNLWFDTTLLDTHTNEPAVLNSRGIMKYDGQNWTNYYEKKKFTGVNIIFEDSKGMIWCGTTVGLAYVGNGLRRINGSSIEMISKVATGFIVEGIDGKIWFGAKNIYSYDGNSIVKYSKKEFGGKKITALHCDNAGNIWVGTKKGVSFFDGNNWKTVSKIPNSPTKKIYTIISDINNNIWIGAEDGVFKYDGKTWQHFTVSDGLMGDATESIKIDFHNNIYAISGKPIGLASKLKIALADKGFSIFKNGRWRAISDIEGAPSNLDLKYFEDKGGNLWFNSTDDVLYKFDGITWTSFNESNGYSMKYFGLMLEDSNGNYWFVGDRIGKFDGQKWSYFTKDSGLPSKIIFSIAEDNEGNIWFGTFKGVVKYTP